METDPLFSPEQIGAAVDRIASEIGSDLSDQRPLVVGILKGSFVFLGDLVRAMDFPVEVDFIRARSYGKGMTSSGAVEITKDVEADLTDRHVVVVEDIADTGMTMEVVVERLKAGHPASIRRCALLVREGCVPMPEYVGFAVGPGFVVGYGIDYAEDYRWLPDIRTIRGTG